MANDFGVAVVLQKDGRSVRIEILVDGKATAAHDFVASELEELIELLGRARESLKDQVPELLDPGSLVRIVSAPTILVQDMPGSEDQLMTIRDPQIGWTGFRLAADTARDLGRLLLKLD